VPCKLHYIVLTHAFLKPVADGFPPEIMELTFFDTGPLQNHGKVPTEIVDYLKARIGIGPFPFGTKLLLGIVASL
jgi:hypothetical protein